MSQFFVFVFAFSAYVVFAWTYFGILCVLAEIYLSFFFFLWKSVFALMFVLKQMSLNFIMHIMFGTDAGICQNQKYFNNYQGEITGYHENQALFLFFYVNVI